MKQFAKFHFSFLLGLGGILLITLTACGVRGPLYLPPPPPKPEKPTKVEPVGIQFPTPSSPQSTPSNKP